MGLLSQAEMGTGALPPALQCTQRGLCTGRLACGSCGTGAQVSRRQRLSSRRQHVNQLQQARTVLSLQNKAEHHPQADRPCARRIDSSPGLHSLVHSPASALGLTPIRYHS